MITPVVILCVLIGKPSRPSQRSTSSIPPFPSDSFAKHHLPGLICLPSLHHHSCRPLLHSPTQLPALCLLSVGPLLTIIVPVSNHQQSAMAFTKILTGALALAGMFAPSAIAMAPLCKFFSNQLPLFASSANLISQRTMFILRLLPARKLEP
jgi:hypothetical protein